MSSADLEQQRPPLGNLQVLVCYLSLCNHCTGDTGNLQEDEKLKEMIYSIYNYVSAQKERDGGEDAR